jgi:alkylated DNA repair protein (DNA oxidative demethylase)
MVKRNDPLTIDLFNEFPDINPQRIQLAENAVILRGYATDIAKDLIQSINLIIKQAPLRQMKTPNGFEMSVRTTSCGTLGWVSDSRGYRYEEKDPLTSKKWPIMPNLFLELAKNAAEDAGYNNFVPDSCLINNYEALAKMGLHQDKDENDFSAPIVSISLGLTATFLFGNHIRSTRPQQHRLEHGDVVVWGKSSRLAFHGIKPIIDGDHPLTGKQRINLTFRKVV